MFQKKSKNNFKHNFKHQFKIDFRSSDLMPQNDNLNFLY